jgi:hypothetical protein
LPKRCNILLMMNQRSVTKRCLITTLVTMYKTFPNNA